MSTDKEIGTRLSEARKAAGYTSAAAAAEAMGIKYSTYAGHENANRGLLGSLERYALRYHVSVDWLLTGRGDGPSIRPDTRPRIREVKLNGFVGAAQTVYQFDEDGAGYVEAPPNATESTEAVEVRGESMLPLYEDGTILYYSKQLPPEMMVGRRCVVRLEDERVLVKILGRGAERGLWTLQSLNAPDIPDVAVQWAAPIDWIKPRAS